MVTKEDGDIKKTAVAAISATAAAGILGPTTAATCVMMAVAAGGVDVLNKLREYRIEEQGGRLFLVKQKFLKFVYGINTILTYK